MFVLFQLGLACNNIDKKQERKYHMFLWLIGILSIVKNKLIVYILVLNPQLFDIVVIWYCFDSLSQGFYYSSIPISRQWYFFLVSVSAGLIQQDMQ